ncbi:Putative transposase [Paracoccus pantotrophus]|nr:Putative transposase [Paracoccus pantotrophus]
MIYAKPPFGEPEAVLAYLSRYTHRVAISNARLVSADAHAVAFRWKDYRIESGDRQKVMRLATPEFIRRVLIHVLPDGFHRIRHSGLLASSARKANITKIRALLCVQQSEQVAVPEPKPEIAPLTMPLLRRCHAHHRDLQAGTDTDVVRATEGTGRMTYRPSSVTKQHRPQTAGPVPTARACSLPARHEAAETPNRTALVEIIGRVCDRIRCLERHQPHSG